MIERASRLAVIDRPCLVIGERGTGKELVTSRLHYLSRRWDGPLVKINCAALSESLLETELFGHEAGAFTGAQRRHVGRFERADGGTLVMDEIANASRAVQEKVLRVIEYGELERVGGDQTLRVDVRVIGATNEDLPALAAAGRFRPDLLDRLAFDVITLPPLRHRPADILPLSRHFALEVSRELGRSVFPGFTDAAVRFLESYPWPGNVRELRNVVERAIYSSRSADAPVDHVVVDPFDVPWRDVDASTPARPAKPTAPEHPENFDAAVGRCEARLIEYALRGASFNQAEAARSLGLGYHRFRRLLKKHGGPPAPAAE